MSISTRTIEYQHNGVLLEAVLAWDNSTLAPRPAVMVAPAWAGRDEFAVHKACALADLGYVGFALDMYGNGIVGSGPEENARLMGPFMEDRALLQGRMIAALETVRQQPEVDAYRVAAIGFCFGGLCVLDLARSGANLNGVVSFHGLFMPPGNISHKKIRAKVLVLHGYDDPMVTPEQMLGLANELTHSTKRIGRYTPMVERSTLSPTLWPTIRASVPSTRKPLTAVLGKAWGISLKKC